jgi:hypothetical protein
MMIKALARLQSLGAKPTISAEDISLLIKISQWMYKLGERVTNRILGDDLPAYSMPQSIGDIKVDFDGDYCPSTFTYKTGIAKGLVKLAAKIKSIPEWPKELDKVASSKAMKAYAKALQANAEENQKAGQVLVAKANKLLAVMDLKSLGTSLKGYSFKEPTREGLLMIKMSKAKDTNLLVYIEREEDAKGRSIRGTPHTLHLTVNPYKTSKVTKITLDLDSSTAQAKEAFDNLLKSAFGEVKKSSGALKALKAKDRALKPYEREFFAAMFTVSNMGLGESEFSGSILSVTTMGRAVSYDLAKRSTKDIGESIMMNLERDMEGEGDATGEYKMWYKDMGKYTLAKIASTWKDRLDLCVYLANRG